MYLHVVKILLFLKENTRTSNNENGFKKSTQILPQRFNQQDLKKTASNILKWFMSCKSDVLETFKVYQFYQNYSYQHLLMINWEKEWKHRKKSKFGEVIRDTGSSSSWKDYVQQGKSFFFFKEIAHCRGPFPPEKYIKIIFNLYSIVWPTEGIQRHRKD